MGWGGVSAKGQGRIFKATYSAGGQKSLVWAKELPHLLSVGLSSQDRRMMGKQTCLWKDRQTTLRLRREFLLDFFFSFKGVKESDLIGSGEKGGTP